MNCPTCGTPNELGRKFCGECGTKLATVCPSCGTTNPAGTRFCGECGTNLLGDAGAATRAGSAPLRPTPAAFDPSAAPGMVAAGPAALAGPVAERRLVSIMFVDLVGFTTLSEGRDPEEVRELLSRYFDASREIIERYGGTVEKFIGDAVMAVWGAPTAHEDDAERAVRAALDVVDAVRGLAAGLEARGGVLTGEAAVTIGATGQGMVAGDLVNTASRLQSAAPPGIVLVGESTQRATINAIAYEAAGEQLLKGKTAPVPAYRAIRVTGERGGRGRSDRLEAGFVGRDSELRLLKDLFHATARERRVRLVSITGQGGVGKSRLAWELRKYADGVVDQVLWHEGRSPAYGDGITFWALGEMIRSRADLIESDDPATTRTKIGAMVARFMPEGEERDRVDRALQVLLGTGEAPDIGAGELFGAWRTFIERMAADRLVVLLFEDLHWADPGTLDFIDHLLEWSRNVPILIVTLARPELLEHRPDWGAGRRNFLALDIGPLDEEAMRQLLAGFVPDLPNAAAGSIVHRAEGIPLYAVETIRMLVADGRLRERAGGNGYDPTGDLGELAIPETLHALIAARLDGLDPAERAMIQDAAVLGQSFTQAGLAAVSGLPAAELEARLRVLVRSDLLHEDVDPRSAERGQYAFVQALIREVAYSTLALKDRRARHLAAARFFESLGDDELAGAQAAHYLAAFKASPAGPEADALASQARVSLRAAADRAIALGSPLQAVSFLEQAVEVAVDDEERATLLERAGMAASTAARSQLALPLIERAEAIRARLDDPAASAHTAYVRAFALYQGRQRDGAMHVASSALALFRDLGPEHPAVIDLTVLLARAAISTGDYDAALDAAERSIVVGERLGLARVVAEALVVKGIVYFYRGRLWEARAVLEGARIIAQNFSLPDVALRAIHNLGLGMALDDPRSAVELEQSGILLARRLGERTTEVTLLGNASEDARRTGDWAWANEEMDSAIQLDIDSANRRALQVVRIGFGLLQGTHTADEATAVVKELEANEETESEGAAHDLLSLVALAAGDWRAAYAELIAQADSSVLNAPYVLQPAGVVATLDGDPDAAQQALERLAKIGTRGRAVDANRIGIEAGVAALRGDRAGAMIGYRQAISGLHDLGVVLDEAWLAMAAGACLGTDDPEIKGWMDRARETLERVGAKPILAHLEAIEGRSSPARSSRSLASAPAPEHSGAETSGA
ncbi:MAG TPA: adenylate/guanylate cyclase domain-containing protein [Candidatus Dormibacteraeota bacterium]|nr:adenylate/guanylate cyclase domain-containing protein [Candidatus Dormibacteraeota bacterium]